MSQVGVGEEVSLVVAAETEEQPARDARKKCRRNTVSVLRLIEVEVLTGANLSLAALTALRRARKARLRRCASCMGCPMAPRAVILLEAPPEAPQQLLKSVPA